MPVENRSLRLTRKIQNIDLEEKNQVGRGDDQTSSPETKPDNQGQGIINNLMGMLPGLGDSDKSSGEPTEEERRENQSQGADLNRVTPDEEGESGESGEEGESGESVEEGESGESGEENTKSLLSEGLDVVRKSHAEYYGVNEEDIIVDEDGDDITTTGESTLLVGTDDITRFSKNMKKGERVAVLFGITPGLKNGLFVYPDYKTIETASTGKEMYNARVVFDKLAVPFDVKPGYSVKILVCYIETIAPVVKDEQLRLPFIPSISIVNYTKKKTIDDEANADVIVADAAEAKEADAAEADAAEADAIDDEEGADEADGSAGINDTFADSVETIGDGDGLTSSIRL